jgi:hypothetical protein
VLIDKDEKLIAISREAPCTGTALHPGRPFSTIGVYHYLVAGQSGFLSRFRPLRNAAVSAGLTDSATET